MDNTSCKNNCQMCASPVCNGKNKTCDYIHKQYGMKKWVFRLILFTIALGAIVPFASETICAVWFPSAKEGLNIWNQFVSIILGITATILSIVSMIMSFKNYDDTLSVQEKYMQALKEIGNIANDLSNVKDDVRMMSFSQGSQVVTKNIEHWESSDIESE